jgi:hypothetical protein
MTEQLNYKVVKTFKNFELRHYPEHVLVQVEGTGDFNSAGSQAFRPLFNYISGDNADSAKIAMTAPVFLGHISDKRHLVSFVLPQSAGLDQIPNPKNSIVTTKKVDEKDVAVLTFSGQWSESFLNQKADQLLASIKQAGLISRGPVYFSRYDPPWKPWFLRRNEALVDLA